MDLKQICRTCLQTNKQRFDIFKSYYTEEKILYADMLCNYTKLKPREDDRLPRLICKDCVKQLKRVYLFNKQCVESDEKLRSQIESKEFTVVDVQNEHFSENRTENVSSFNDDNDDKFLVSLLDERSEGSYKKEEIKTEPVAVDNNEENGMCWESENMLLKEVKSKEIPDSEMKQSPGPSREGGDEDKVPDYSESESDHDEAPQIKRARKKQLPGPGREGGDEDKVSDYSESESDHDEAPQIKRARKKQLPGPGREGGDEDKVSDYSESESDHDEAPQIKRARKKQLPGPGREGGDEDKVSDYSESESDHDEAPQIKRARKKLWLYLNKFASLIDSEDFVNAERTWSRKYMRKRTDGQKIYYRCNKVKKRGPQCAAELMCVCAGGEVRVYRKYAEHDHDDICKQDRYGIRESTKSRIDKLFSMNLKSKDILDSLKNMDGIEMPSKIQLDEYLSSKKRLTFDNPAITLNEMAKWILGRVTAPACENEPFVMKYQLINVDSPILRFALTTRKLLRYACSVDVLHADSTCDLTWQGLPILTVGMTDKGRKFYPLCLAVATDERREDFELMFSGLRETLDKLFGYDFRPKVLVSDGTRAIGNAFSNVFGTDTVVRMCWSHARRNIKKKLYQTVEVDMRDRILEGIDDLHKAYSTPVFNAASQAFIEKYEWTSAFIEYFERRYVTENRNWFLGAAPLSPVTNDALVALNKSINDQNTLRERLPFSRFMTAVGKMIGDWSRQIETDCSYTINIELADWIEGVRWAKQDVTMKILSSDATTTTYLVSNTEIDTCDDDDDDSWVSFDEYREILFEYSKTTLVKSEWKKSTCTCTEFFKKYVCKHILGLALRLKMEMPPLTPISQLKSANRKRVRSTERDSNIY